MEELLLQKSQEGSNYNYIFLSMSFTLRFLFSVSFFPHMCVCVLKIYA